MLWSAPGTEERSFQGFRVHWEPLGAALGYKVWWVFQGCRILGLTV